MKSYKGRLIKEDLLGDVFAFSGCVGARMLRRLSGVNKVSWGSCTGRLYRSYLSEGESFMSFDEDKERVNMMALDKGDVGKVIIFEEGKGY